MRVDRRDLPVRFFERIEFEPNGCWIWTGALAGNGYGSFSWKGCRVSAHRFAYTFLVDDIPDDLTIDHLCRAIQCVNPMHMDLVTNSENVKRAARLREANRTTCVHGHPLDDENVIVFADGRRRCRTCRRNQSRTYVRPDRRKSA